MQPRVFLFLLGSSLLGSGVAPALTVQDFGRMNHDDQADYVTSLVEGASSLLKAQGHEDQANQVVALFRETGDHGGVHQFATNLRAINTLNNRNATNPNNKMPVYQIEDAMSLTLKENGILVSAKELLTINRNFSLGPKIR